MREVFGRPSRPRTASWARPNASALINGHPIQSLATIWARALPAMPRRTSQASGPGFLAGSHRFEVYIVQRHVPLEKGHEQHVVEGLCQIHRVPLLMRVDPHDLVAQVLALATDVGEGVVDVVV